MTSTSPPPRGTPKKDQKTTFALIGGLDKRGDKVCQDSILVAENWCGIATLLVVADGHGDGGEVAASLATSNMPSFLKAALDEELPKWASMPYDSPRVARSSTVATGFCRALKLAFLRVNKIIEDQVPSQGGTTCVVSLVLGRLVVTGACGDSRAMLVVEPQNSGGDMRGTCDIVALSVDHGPGNKAEAKRVRESGGVIARSGESSGNPTGPFRVWRGDALGTRGAVGLAMTRSLGDRHLKSYGVICDPVVSLQWAPRRTDATLVMASDGVFDVLPLERVAEVACEQIGADERVRLEIEARHRFAKSPPILPAPDQLARRGVRVSSPRPKTQAAWIVAFARARWESLSPYRIDDISCITVHLPRVASRAATRSAPRVDTATPQQPAAAVASSGPGTGHSEPARVEKGARAGAPAATAKAEQALSSDPTQDPTLGAGSAPPQVPRPTKPRLSIHLEDPNSAGEPQAASPSAQRRLLEEPDLGPPVHLTGSGDGGTGSHRRPLNPSLKLPSLATGDGHETIVASLAASPPSPSPSSMRSQDAGGGGMALGRRRTSAGSTSSVDSSRLGDSPNFACDPDAAVGVTHLRRSQRPPKSLDPDGIAAAGDDETSQMSTPHSNVSYMSSPFGWEQQPTPLSGTGLRSPGGRSPPFSPATLGPPSRVVRRQGVHSEEIRAKDGSLVTGPDAEAARQDTRTPPHNRKAGKESSPAAVGSAFTDEAVGSVASSAIASQPGTGQPLPGQAPELHVLCQASLAQDQVLGMDTSDFGPPGKVTRPVARRRSFRSGAGTGAARQRPSPYDLGMEDTDEDLPIPSATPEEAAGAPESASAKTEESTAPPTATNPIHLRVLHAVQRKLSLRSEKE